MNAEDKTDKLEQKQFRKPISREVKVFVYHRDLWLCRWCKRPVIFAPAMKFLQEELKNAGFQNLALWQFNFDRTHSPLLDELAAVIDHVEAVAVGGGCDAENLATACNKCNIRKNMRNARKFAEQYPIRPIKAKHGEPTAWDGFSGLFIFLANKNPTLLTSTERAWLRALINARNGGK